MKQTVNVNGGIGVTGLLGIVFVTLKLIGIIKWSWWWVTLPFWFWIGILGSIGLIGMLYFVLVWIWEQLGKKGN